MSSINQPKPSFYWSFYVFQLYGGDQFYWWRKPRYEEKNTNLRKPDYVRKTLICRKSPTSYKTSVVLNTTHHVHESQLYQYVDASPTAIWSQPQQPLQIETTISIFLTDVPCHSSYIRCDGGYKCYNPEVYGPRFCKGI
jgi:hypothetical protein